MKVPSFASLPRTPKRFEREMLVWRAATLVVLVCAIFFPAYWKIVATVYLAIVSNYALDLTASGAAEAAAARQAAENTEDKS